MIALSGVALVGLLASISVLGNETAPSPIEPAPIEPAPIEPTPEPRVVAKGSAFSDRFDAYDRSLWKVSHGWRNGDWTANDWRRSQAVFDDGVTLTLQRKPSDRAEFAGAEIQSKRRYGHGYYEVRMRAAKGSGTVSGFFTYTGPPFGDPWNEIDVEILGSKPREVMFTYYRDGEKIEHRHALDFDTTEGFHTYGFDWQPEHLRWYVDGKLAYSATPSELALPYLPQKLMMSLWGSETLTDWVGPLDRKALPTQMKVACVSYSESHAQRIACDGA